MTPDERAPLEALADRWEQSHLTNGWAPAELRSVLASIPATTATAPTGLREALAEVVDRADASMANYVFRSDLVALLDRFPAPVRPEDGVPLADGWHLKRMGEPRDDSWGVFGPNGQIYVDDDTAGLAAVGQPVPSPAPERVGPEGLSEAETRFRANMPDEEIDKHWPALNTGSVLNAAMRTLRAACREAVAGWDEA